MDSRTLKTFVECFSQACNWFEDKRHEAILNGGSEEIYAEAADTFGYDMRDIAQLVSLLYLELGERRNDNLKMALLNLVAKDSYSVDEHGNTVSK